MLVALATTAASAAPGADSPASSAGKVSRVPPPAIELTAPAASAVAGILVFQLGVAVYGGYFGAGASILILSALAALRVGDVNQMNALKTVLSACINGISVVVFVAEKKVAWHYAVPMTVAAILGGYLGARMALVIQPRRTKWFISAIGLGLAAYFFLGR